MFKKAFLWGLFVAAALMLLLSHFGVPGVQYAITVNGEEIHTLPGAVFAMGELLVAGIAMAGVLALVALVLAGTSMVLLGMFAVFFLILLGVFSPVLAVFAGAAIAVALVVRKRKGQSTQGVG